MSVTDFDWSTVPLSGMQLIEASAGTGKTWTLTVIYLRLLLETDLQPENILVVTFTKAATAELKERLRTCLTQTWALLSGFTLPAGAHDDILYQRYGKDAYLLRKLNRAIRHFDRAAVYTIHGFCQRVLADHAFSMGTAFEWALNPDDGVLIKRVVDDFWAQHIAPHTGLWPLFLYTQKITPNTWLLQMKKLLGKANYSKMLVPTVAQATLEAEYTKAYHCARTLWQNAAEQIKLSVQASKLGYRQSSFDKLAHMFFSPSPHFDWGDPSTSELSIQRFSTTTLSQLAQDKNKPIPNHPFFQAIDCLLVTYHALLSDFWAKQADMLASLLHHCEEALPKLKRQQREVAYNDLLVHVDQALQQSVDGKMAQLLSLRFKAALIDEFQDTDPVQYRIFSQIYHQTACPVFLIGDPKQAIYSFRGADIYTYLNAQGNTSAQWTLQKNYRSTPSLLTSLNYLFEQHKTPFWLPQIEYRKIDAGEKVLPVFDDPDGTAALHCWQLEADNTLRLTKEMALAQALTVTGIEIQRLLQKATIAQQPLAAGDIAILVPTHQHAEQVLAHLTAIGVPAVRLGMESVLSSHDAWEWLRVLSAFLFPQRESLRKNALMTMYMGVDAQHVLTLIEDEAKWEAIALQFMQYHLLWQRHGITRAFRTWLSDWQVAPRMMRLKDGERRLTNLLHLIDILQQKNQTMPHLPMLVDWFTREIVKPSVDEDIAQLRLESDAVRVKIMTIHAAKGLEFPVVFCPFLWHVSGRENPQEVVVFHDEAGQSYLDFGSAKHNQNKLKALDERFAEQLRVLYVALTRAKYRNYITWGKVSGVEKTALSWLLYGGKTASLTEFMQQVKDLDEAAWWQPWHGAPDITLAALPTLPVAAVSNKASAAVSLSTAVWHRSARLQQQMLSSFSSITQAAHAEVFDENDRLKLDQVPGEMPLEGIALFPAGSRTGLCWHSILENWDFQSTVALSELIVRKLQEYGFPTHWESQLTPLFLAVSHIQLANEPLSAISATRTVRELGFTFRIKPVMHTELIQLLQRAGESHWANACQMLRFDIAQGFMTGFIDLVVETGGRYFILDYKSNRLGPNVSVYHPIALQHAMASNHYYLQYLIYSVAVHRYLRQRMPNYDYEHHFGGVVYIFMRGVVAGTESGIFRDRPSLSLITELDQLLDRPLC